MKFLFLLLVLPLAAFAQETPVVASLQGEDAITSKVMIRQFNDYLETISRLRGELAAIQDIAVAHRKKLLEFQAKALSDRKLSPEEYSLDFDKGVFVKAAALPKAEPPKPPDPTGVPEEWRQKWDKDAKR